MQKLSAEPGSSQVDAPAPLAVLEIVEIVGRSDQGIARPYLCRGEDGQLYYVKSRQSGRDSLWNEWICAHLARAFGLNVPPFCLVNIDAALLDEAPREWRELGAGIGFGSQQHPVATWLELAMVNEVPISEQMDVVVFDWWVHNMDRSTGNTNLLWSPDQRRLVVIDHNQAFDPYFDPDVFLSTHVFAHHLPDRFTDVVLRAEYATRMSNALSGLQVACDNLPDEWRWANPEMDVPALFDLDGARALLERCSTDELWRPE